MTITDNTPWPTDQVEVLRRSWAAGLSAGRIAPLVGRSRSAVLGKLKRLHLLCGDRTTALAVVPSPTPRRPRSQPTHQTWSDARLTEKWADRKKRKQAS